MRLGKKGYISKEECCRLNLHLKIIYKGICGYCGHK